MSGVKKIFSAIIVVALTAVGAYLGGPIGAFIGQTIGLAITNALFGQGGGTRQEASKVNVRLAEPIRWMAGGRTKVGGAVIFAEYDSLGNLWYLVVHADSLCTGSIEVYLDNQLVTLDGSGVVQGKDYRLLDNKEKDPATVDGTGIGYIQVWTTTYTETDPTPPAVSALAAAFPGIWTSDHKLVGTTYSVVKMTALEIEHRYKIYKWRGALGMGEPSIAIVADWSKVYDPRNEDCVLGDRSTYVFSRNAALIWAWFRTHPFGRRKPESSINWDMIAEQADICDEVVEGIDGDTERYKCDAVIPEDRTRAIAEQEILITMDGQIVFDDEGKAWCRAGKFYTTDFTLVRNRDIVAMQSVEAQDGESETQGVVVRYTDPDASYEIQPSAPWINPLYYTPGESVTYAGIDALFIQDHNQALRVGKAIGMRMQPEHKIAPTSSLRGLRGMRERIVDILYDNTFTGLYEIATQVEIDASGQLCRFGLVPVDESRWELLPGEETPKPVADGSGVSDSFPAITGESVSYSDGTIVIAFPTAPRPDASYLAEYIVTTDITGGSSDPWLLMTINTTSAVSGPVSEGVGYTVRYRYVIGSGRGTAWEYDTITPAVSLNPPTELDTTDGVGEVVVEWRNSTDARVVTVVVWRNTTTDFNTATDVSGDQTSDGLGVVQTYTDTVVPGTYQYWVVGYDAASNASAEIGPVAGTSS